MTQNKWAVDEASASGGGCVGGGDSGDSGDSGGGEGGGGCVGGWEVLLLAAVVVVLAVLLVLAAVMVAVAVALKMTGASHLSSSTPKRGGKVKQFFCGRRVAAGVCAQRRPSADAAPSPGCNRQQTKHREHTSAHGSQ